jgi:hypothetical protein
MQVFGEFHPFLQIVMFEHIYIPESPTDKNSQSASIRRRRKQAVSSESYDTLPGKTVSVNMAKAPVADACKVTWKAAALATARLYAA